MKDLVQSDWEYTESQAPPRWRNVFPLGFICGLLVGVIATGIAWSLVEGRSSLSRALPSSLQSPKDRLVGKWTSENGKCIEEYLKDGTCIFTGNTESFLGGSASGRYRWIDETRIAVTLSGLFAIAGTQVGTVAFQDDQLIITSPEGNRSTSRRVRE